MYSLCRNRTFHDNSLLKNRRDQAASPACARLPGADPIVILGLSRQGSRRRAYFACLGIPLCEKDPIGPRGSIARIATTVWSMSEDFRRGSFYLRVSRRITQRRLPLRCQPRESGSLSLAPDCLADSSVRPVRHPCQVKSAVSRSRSSKEISMHPIT